MKAKEGYRKPLTPPDYLSRKRGLPKQEAPESNSLSYAVALFWLSLAFLCSPGLSFAAFEDIGAGARPLGMGSVFTAIADDANTVYYNPAGLGQLRHPQLTAGYGRLYLGLTDGSNIGSGFLGLTVPLQEGRWGTLGVGALNLQLVGAYAEDVYSLSYGRQIMPALFGGASLKWMRRGFGSDAYTANDPLFQQHGRTASALGVDLGLLYRYSSSYVLAVSVKDFNRPDAGLGSRDRVPPAWKAGFAYYQRAFVVGMDLTQKDRDRGLAIGGERWFFRHLVAGRTGLDFGSRNKRDFTLGTSVRMGNAQLDYSFLLPLAGIVDTSGSHRLSLTIRFGKVEAGPIALLEQEEILGPSTDSAQEVESLKKDLARFQQESENYQKETAQVEARVKELEKQLQPFRGQQAPFPAAPAASPLPQPAAPPETAPESQEMKQKIDQMEQELQKQRAALEKRRQAPPTPPAALKKAFKRPGVYTVRAGDTLQSIAEKTMGDSGRWAEIYQANKDRLKRGGAVTPGQILIIP